MTSSVADRSSNKNEQIVHAAEVLGRSKHRAMVFKAVYTGKTRIKTVLDVMNSTNLPRTRALDAGKALADNDLIVKTKINGVTAYEKVEFFQRYRDQVLRLANNEQARKEIPTKRNVSNRAQVKIAIAVRAPESKVQAEHITIDDIASFDAVKMVSLDQSYIKMPETTFKNGVAKILGERANFNDWGGELRDLSSTRLIIKGQRRIAAIAFKGPGTTGKLTPKKMGKNGDQVQRLAKCSAEAFLVQYWGEIDDSVLEQLEGLIRLKAYFEGRQLWYGIIDGQDSARIVKAYSKHFPSKFLK